MTDRICPWWLGYVIDNPLRHLLHRPRRIVAPYVGAGMKVGDIGCGMGLFTIAMARLVGDAGAVVAVDLQQKMLDALRRRAERAGVAARIRLRHAAEDDLRITERLDFALAFWMVHEVKDIPGLFSQVSAALAPAGKFLVVEPRLHVSASRFEEILTLARAGGFRIGEGPKVRFSRSAILSNEASGGGHPISL